MLYKKHISACVATAVVVLSCSVLQERCVAADSGDSKTKALEERVQQLEKRLAELEANGAKTPNMMQPQFPPATPRNFGMQQNDFNRMFEEMQKQMMEHDGGFGFNMPPMGPPNGMPRRSARKPALGVGVDELSDELKTRFKNDIKEGAFVLSVYPGSPAEKAGIAVGDAITAFDGKAIVGPKALIDAVKTAGEGTHEIMVARHGELLKMKVDLEAQEANDRADANGLLNVPVFPGADGNIQARSELSVSTFELSDTLATELKLSDAQKKSMSAILAKHAKGLSEEVAKSSQVGNGLNLEAPGDIGALATKHGDLAAADLATVLSAEQLKQWNDYRATHQSISFSQSIQHGNVSAQDAAPEEKETIKF